MTITVTTEPKVQFDTYEFTIAKHINAPLETVREVLDDSVSFSTPDQHTRRSSR